VKKKNAENSEKYNQAHLAAVQKYNHKHDFPPHPPSEKLQHSSVHDFCEEILPNKFIESGCGVCGKLTHISKMQKLSECDLDLGVLKNSGVTQKQRSSVHDHIEDLNGPIVIENLDYICIKCHKSISKGERPHLSLANGLWIGNIPTELSELSYAEQLLIAKVRHNRCIVRVSSGMHKMRANAIVFANPTPKIYNILPPALDEFDEILAFIYTGPCKPTRLDLE
jgi:hypothetical protein